MRLKKTNQTNRTTYTYCFTDTDDKGKTFIRKQTLRPGEDGVTEIDIKLLHSLDDSEVYINIKNMRPPVTDEQKAEQVSHYSYLAISRKYDSVPDVLSELVRTAFVPQNGRKFIVADFSAIEARVIAWFAGEDWRKEVFASGGDIYCASASQMFKVPVVKNGENGHLRQKGKIAELALGYGGSVGALKAMGALEMGLSEEELGYFCLSSFAVF